MGETSWVAFFCLPFFEIEGERFGRFCHREGEGLYSRQEELMEQSTNELLYNLATALILDLLVNNKITQAEFEKIDALNKESFGVG